MEHFTIIGAVVIIVCALFSYWKRLGEREEECVPPVEGNYSALAGADNTSEKSDDVETEDVNVDLQQLNTKELVIDTLKKIGCKPEEDDDGRLHIDYQEWHFMILCGDTYFWISVDFPFWYEFSTYDINLFSRMQKAVNEANSMGTCSVSVYYTVAKETDTVYLNSNIFLSFVPQIPRLDDYLREALKILFASRYFVCNKIKKTEMKEDDGI